MIPATPLTIESFEFEVDPYSMFDGEPTADFDLAGGTVVLKGHLAGIGLEAAVSGASLPQALGHALTVLIRERPTDGVGAVRITAYVDGENGRLMQLDRDEKPGPVQQ